MSTNAISGLSNNSLESILNTALQGTGLQLNNNSSTGTSAVQTSDNSQLSPFAALVSTLQNLQQTNPSEYQQVTQQIATNLQSAAQSAQSSGNTTEANQLSQLATDFQNASTSGQLPNLQDLAKAIGGHHHHHHGGGSSDSSASSSTTNSDGASSTSTSSTSSSSQLEQLLASLQTAGSENQSRSLNPLAIIQNTLSSAGIVTSGS